MVDIDEQEVADTPEEDGEELESFSSSTLGLFSNIWVQVGIAVFVLLLAVLIGVGFFVRQKSVNAAQDPNQTSKQQINKKYKFVPAFAELTPMDAAQIRKVLSYENMPFESVKDGRITNIAVPKEFADEIKLKMAQLGLPEGGIVGFEIFDEAAGLGATDYDRRIKYMRAVSGELSRIISTMEHIQSARVQIVMPAKTLFGEKVPGSTSVILNIEEGYGITDQKVRGIMHLVASSVENVTPENVTVIDNKGEILSEMIKKDMITKDAGNFMRLLRVADGEQESPLELLLKFKKELKDDYEKDYTQKVEDVLDGLYPDGSFMIYVNVTLTESYKESAPYEIGRINVAIILDSDNSELNFSQELKQSTFKLVSSVIAYVKGRDKIVLELMPFVNIEATQDLRATENVVVDNLNLVENSYANEKKNSLSWIFIVLGLLLLASGAIVFVVYFLSSANVYEQEEAESEEPVIPVQEMESREQDVDFALEKFRSFINNNEELVVKKIIKWMREDDNV